MPRNVDPGIWLTVKMLLLFGEKHWHLVDHRGAWHVIAPKLWWTVLGDMLG